MKLREVFRFEFGYQARRLSTALCFVLVVGVAFQFVRGAFLQDALYADFYINSPFIIASALVICSLFWLVVAAVVTGEVAARDAEVGMDPIAYTAPVSKAVYLGGRFLAAFALNLLILLAIPLGVLLAVYLPGVDAAVVGPFRPVAYLTAFAYFALPNCFLGTSIQFAWATLSRRSIASYLGSVLLLFVAYAGLFAVMFFLERKDLALLIDAFGHIYMTSDVVLGWTPIEKSTRLIALDGNLLLARSFWFGIAVGALALTYARFRFAHPTASSFWGRLGRRGKAHAPTPGGSEVGRGTFAVPVVRQSFGFATYARQTRLIAGDSFRALARGRGGLVLLGVLAALAVLAVPSNMFNLGTPLLPRTEYVLSFLTAPLTEPMTAWVVIPLLIAYYAGELVWREREAGLGEIGDAAPVPEGARFLGRFLGLGGVLVVWMGLLTLAGVLIQVRMGYDVFELGLYLRVLFGLHLPDLLLFAVLALAVQGVARQKYVGHMVVLVAYAFTLFAGRLGVGHHLLVYASGPGWMYTDMRGFGPSLGPWAWFRLYWAAWALVLAVAATLFGARGREGGWAARLAQARLRLTRPMVAVGAVAAGLVVVLGGFVFYNTNVLNEYLTADERLARHAEYERRYARYADAPQPALEGTALRVELYPARRAAEIRGTYRLVNRTGAPIDTIHVAPTPGVETGAVTFDRPAWRVLEDARLGHRIYALRRPLGPGEALRLSFTVRVAPRGFRNGGVDASITDASSFFSNGWLPALGYQPNRELLKPSDRRAHGLVQRPLLPTAADADVTGEAPDERVGGGRITFEAVMGTAGDQIAVAPGVLRRTWTAGGRRYFHYATEEPIGDGYRFFSARYAVHEETWRPSGGGGRPVSVQVYHHAAHAASVPRILRSVRASLDLYSRAYGPYPYSYLRVVENPGGGVGAHAEPTTIDYTEGFTRFNPDADPRGLDLPFAVMAHEMAHEWGVPYAYAEGAALLTESFAWYAAMGVVETHYGREHLEQLRRFFRQPYPIPPIRQSLPLLRAMDPYAAYRKGPFALYALAEYAGRDRVDLAFRRLRETHLSGAPPLPTSLDLYRELEAVTPDSLGYLLHDLFAANTFWELTTTEATAEPTPEGAWRVTLRVRARKVTVDEAGVEAGVPMGEWIPIGVFGRTEEGSDFGETLYLQRHRIRSGEQTITVTVPREPADAGIDPYHLLIDLEPFDNVEEVEIKR